MTCESHVTCEELTLTEFSFSVAGWLSIYVKKMTIYGCHALGMYGMQTSDQFFVSHVATKDNGRAISRRCST